MVKTKLIVGIEGIDNSGKTTLINLLIKRMIGLNISTKQSPKRIELEKDFPKTLKERKQWYKESHLEEIIMVNLNSALKRNNASFNMDENFIFENRGYSTIFSSMIALAMDRLGISYKEGRDLVNTMNKEINYSPIENISYALSFGFPFGRALQEIRRRDVKGEINPGFEKYLENFNYSFEIVISKQKNIEKVNAYNPLSKIVDYVSSHLFSIFKEGQNEV